MPSLSVRGGVCGRAIWASGVIVARYDFGMAVSDPDPQELNRRAAAVNEILSRIGLSGGGAGMSEWWNFVSYDELGGRTPTQAWLAGEHEAVEKLVMSWFDRSEQAARRAQDDQAFLRMLDERRRALTHVPRRTA